MTIYTIKLPSIKTKAIILTATSVAFFKALFVPSFIACKFCCASYVKFVSFCSVYSVGFFVRG